MEQMVNTSIRVPESVWKKLRALAEARALRAGGRPSNTAVVQDLINEAAARELPAAEQANA